MSLYTRTENVTLPEVILCIVVQVYEAIFSSIPRIIVVAVNNKDPKNITRSPSGMDCRRHEDGLRISLLLTNACRGLLSLVV